MGGNPTDLDDILEVAAEVEAEKDTTETKEITTTEIAGIIETAETDTTKIDGDIMMITSERKEATAIDIRP